MGPGFKVGGVRAGAVSARSDTRGAQLQAIIIKTIHILGGSDLV